MAAKIETLDIFPPGEDLYYDPDFLAHVSSLADTLRNSAQTTTVEITPHEANIYQGDFRGYLFSLGISDHHHGIIMRVNRIEGSDQFTADRTFFYLPSAEKINEVVQLYNAFKRV